MSLTDVAHKIDVREAVMDSADKLFARYGYKKTTVEDIASDMRISRATLYLHFHSKEEIALCWIGRFNAGLQVELRTIANEACDPVNRLKHMLVARVMKVFNHASRYSESIDDLLAALRPSLMKQRQQKHEAESRIFAGVISDGQLAGQFVVGDPIELARLLVDATNSLLPYNLSAQQLGERELMERRINALANLLLNGIETREVNPEREMK